ncbi:MAG: protein kinase [Planctomycetota bacterium]
MLAAALEAIDAGESIDVAALCAQHPHLSDSFQAALSRLGHLPTMHRAAVADAPDPMAGVLLQRRYLVEERVGSGAMGVVYRALDRELHRHVAVKILRPELVVGEKLDQRLAREGEVLAGIRHRNVVTLYDRGQAPDGRAFLVMELLRGKSAAQVLAETGEEFDPSSQRELSARERLEEFRNSLGDGAVSSDSDIRQVVRWAAEAAAGLHAAHSAGVVHRDVKPSNLFVEHDGRVVVLDFGIVSMGSHLTVGADGSPLGTPAFMAPEQLDVGREHDRRTDVYGLSATLYHLLTGAAPYSGAPQQVLSQLLRSDPRPADTRRLGLPRDLVAVLEMGMARDLGRRYPSAMDLREDLLAWLDFRPVKARRVSRVAVWSRRMVRSPFVRGMAAVALLSAAGVGWWVWQDRVQQAEVAERVEMEAEWSELFRQVPPALLVAPPSYRESSAVTSDSGVRERLDRMVALGVNPETSLALRYLLRSDAGEFEAAAADMDRLAALGGAEYCVEAAAALREGRLPDRALRSRSAPEYEALADRLACGVSALRALEPTPAWVVTLFDHAGAGADGLASLMAVAEMLRIGGMQPQDRAESSRALLDRVEGLRGKLGDSAILCHVRGNLLVQGRRLVEAFESAREGLGMAPVDGALAVLVGNTCAELRRLDEAERLLNDALRLQPKSITAHMSLFEIQLAQSRVSDAEATLAATPFPKSLFADRRQVRAEALLAYCRSLSAEDEDTRIAFAERARSGFRRLRQRGKAREFAEVACDIFVDSTPDLLTELLEVWRESPVEVWHLRQIPLLLKGPLNELQVELLSEVVRAQAIDLAKRG